MKFDSLVAKIYEDFNIFPKPLGPNTFRGSNMDVRGSLPTGFKGAGPQGIAPGREDQLLIKVTKKKKLLNPSKKRVTT
jgi:hypothetical protein